MLPGCWIAALLLLLLLPAARAQSGDGDGDGDGDVGLSCTSDLLTAGSSLSCRPLAGRGAGDDEDDDEEAAAAGVEGMTVCFKDVLNNNREECRDVRGDTATGLSPLPALNVSVHLKGGRTVSTTVDLRKIIKPQSPQVKNVTFDRESNLAEFHIQTPYADRPPSRREYLGLDTQLFELRIGAAGSAITQNVSAHTLRIDLQQLQGRARWDVQVRALPVNGLQGTWSDWSETVSFRPPGVQAEGRDVHKLIVCLLILLVLPSSVVLFWKNKIFNYVWPSIPHPKHTLVHICKPNKGLLLNFKPEEFSALRVESSEEPREGPQPPLAAAAGGAASDPSCSAQSSACSRSTTSVGTEELELSALLSGEDGPHSADPAPHCAGPAPHSADPAPHCAGPAPHCAGPAPHCAGPAPLQDLRPPGRPEPGCSSGGNESEAYVTMSSFYQIQ